MQSVYSTYCKQQESALIRLQEIESPDCKNTKLSSFFAEAKKELQGRTGAWDVGSLLIKPVQRVLKYPLLIKQLLDVTSIDHADYESLKQANIDLANLAGKVNEVKKRKDLVEKYLQGKGGIDLM